MAAGSANAEVVCSKGRGVEEKEQKEEEEKEEKEEPEEEGRVKEKEEEEVQSEEVQSEEVQSEEVQSEEVQSEEVQSEEVQSEEEQSEEEQKEEQTVKIEDKKVGQDDQEECLEEDDEAIAEKLDSDRWISDVTSVPWGDLPWNSSFAGGGDGEGEACNDKRKVDEASEEGSESEDDESSKEEHEEEEEEEEEGNLGFGQIWGLQGHELDSFNGGLRHRSRQRGGCGTTALASGHMTGHTGTVFGNGVSVTTTTRHHRTNFGNAGMGLEELGFGLSFGRSRGIGLNSLLEDLQLQCGTQERHWRWKVGMAAGLILAGLWCVAVASRPSESSFRTVVSEGYYSKSREGLSKPPWPLLADRSFEGVVTSTPYVNRRAFALAKVALKVEAVPPSKGSKPKGAVKVYEHRYLGVFNTWVPLPYLPQLGRKPGFYGLGACVLGQCICMPNLPGLSNTSATAASGKAAGKSSGGSDCWRFEGGKSAALNVMTLSNGLMFFLWQWSAYRPALKKHAALSMANLAKGRIWVFFLAPISHEHWAQMFHTAVVLANTIDSFDAAAVPFWLFAVLYWGGVAVSWYGKDVLWRWLIRGELFAFESEEIGASRGLISQLAFLAMARPDAKYQFNLYMIPTPATLTAWQSALAHVALDLAGNVRLSKLFGHVAAAAFGILIGTAWAQHAV